MKEFHTRNYELSLKQLTPRYDHGLHSHAHVAERKIVSFTRLQLGHHVGALRKNVIGGSRVDAVESGVVTHPVGPWPIRHRETATDHAARRA